MSINPYGVAILIGIVATNMQRNAELDRADRLAEQREWELSQPVQEMDVPREIVDAYVEHLEAGEPVEDDAVIFMSKRLCQPTFDHLTTRQLLLLHSTMQAVAMRRLAS